MMGGLRHCRRGEPLRYAIQSKAQRCEKEGSDRVSEGYLTAQLIGTESIRMRWSKNESDVEACIAHLRFPVSSRPVNCGDRVLRLFSSRGVCLLYQQNGKIWQPNNRGPPLSTRFVSFLAAGRLVPQCQCLVVLVQSARRY
jgi:hypothetical protein